MIVEIFCGIEGEMLRAFNAESIFSQTCAFNSAGFDIMPFVEHRTPLMVGNLVRVKVLQEKVRGMLILFIYFASLQ